MQLFRPAGGDDGAGLPERPPQNDGRQVAAGAEAGVARDGREFKVAAQQNSLAGECLCAFLKESPCHLLPHPTFALLEGKSELAKARRGFTLNQSHSCLWKGPWISIMAKRQQSAEPRPHQFEIRGFLLLFQCPKHESIHPKTHLQPNAHVMPRT